MYKSYICKAVCAYKGSTKVLSTYIALCKIARVHTEKPYMFDCTTLCYVVNKHCKCKRKERLVLALYFVTAVDTRQCLFISSAGWRKSF